MCSVGHLKIKLYVKLYFVSAMLNASTMGRVTVTQHISMPQEYAITAGSPEPWTGEPQCLIRHAVRKTKECEAEATTI